MKNPEHNGVYIWPVDKPMLFDETTIASVLREIDQLLATGSFRHLVLDFSRVAWAGSPALTLLLRLQARCEQLDRGFGLCGLQPTVRDVLCITNLDQLFQIYEDADEAIGALSGRQISIA